MNTTRPCTAIAAKVMQLGMNIKPTTYQNTWPDYLLLQTAPCLIFTRIPDQTICYYRQHPAWYSPEYLTRLSVITDSTLPGIHQNTWPDYLLLQTAPCLIFTRIPDQTICYYRQHPAWYSPEYLTRLSAITDSTLPDIHQNTWPDYLLLQTAPCPIFTRILVQIYCNAIFFYYYFFKL